MCCQVGLLHRLLGVRGELENNGIYVIIPKWASAQLLDTNFDSLSFKYKQVNNKNIVKIKVYDTFLSSLNVSRDET